ncbi:carboxymuconolactone decarboxylase family protein [Amycolatopsis cihanbeyliensis]|uniref:Putative peroxidase-related enzyme n=1 Tax=Amycolatopsis cihanbeyliensis TaxID=1128664 RepID=A0A542DF66_AMYCI|nr:peroxidase-related enzyme [Amycolatopsis cihanbeyliensis]TQJ01738.1 putative peroxidase-related enzyme [Amycolatopsis cihanbeyliensis]
MTYLPSLPEGATLLDVFRSYPQTSAPLVDYHQVLLRGPSPLSVAERELIAAYVSGLNACHYCHGVHTATAEAFGIAEGTLTALLSDVDTAPVEDWMKPLLRYVGKLTLTPSRMTDADVDAVRAAGWDERALHDAVSVCALFNFMNRLVEGLGITATGDYFATSAQRLTEGGYAGLKKLFDQEP